MYLWPIYDKDEKVGEVDFWGLCQFLWDGPSDLTVAVFAPRWQPKRRA